MPKLEENFKVGDLLYGLKDVRTQTSNRIKQEFEDKQENAPSLKTVDNYNNVILFRLLDEKKEYQKTLRDDFLEELEKAKLLAKWAKGPAFVGTQLDIEEVKKHIDALESVENFPHLSIKNPPKSNKQKKISKEDKQFRRACKARLAHGETNIHFLLDKIDAEHVFDREFSVFNSSKNERSIYDSFTSAELHFVFKNYDVIKNHVKFYIQGEEIDLMSWIKLQNNTVQLKILNWLDSAKDKAISKQKNINNTVFHQEIRQLVQDLEDKQEKILFTPPSTPERSSNMETPPQKTSATAKRKLDDSPTTQKLDYDSPPTQKIPNPPKKRRTDESPERDSLTKTPSKSSQEESFYGSPLTFLPKAPKKEIKKNDKKEFVNKKLFYK